MTLIYRVRFVRPCTESTAREAVEGINGGNVRSIRTADDGNNTTAWFAVTIHDDVSDEAAAAYEAAIDAELEADSRVGEFSSTGDYSGQLAGA